MDNTQRGSEGTDQSPSQETIDALWRTIQDLQARTEALETERQELLEENRLLRRDLTHSRLVADLKASEGALKERTRSAPAVPPTTEDLYQTLPSSFTYSAFFQIAENKGLDMEDARGCLRTFLATNLVVQEGSRLKKQTSNKESSKSDGFKKPLFREEPASRREEDRSPS